MSLPLFFIILAGYSKEGRCSRVKWARENVMNISNKNNY
jgi:hypothetical protein